MNELDDLVDEPVKQCSVCRDYTLFRYDYCENCGNDISDAEPIAPEDFLERGEYEY